MKICVPIKRTVDYRVRVRVRPDGTGVDTAQVKHDINPFDAIALEAALRLKEKRQADGLTDHIAVLSLGEEPVQSCLRKALAMGADQAHWLQVDTATAASLQPLAVAQCLLYWVEKNQPDLVIMGKQAIDDDCNQVGQMLAGLLGWPQATFASAITVCTDTEKPTVVVVREVDRGLETVRLVLPAVVTADLRLNTPRYPSLPAIMRARHAAITAHNVGQWGVSLTPRLRVTRVSPPPGRRPGQRVDSLQALLAVLQTLDVYAAQRVVRK